MKVENKVTQLHINIIAYKENKKNISNNEIALLTSLLVNLAKQEKYIFCGEVKPLSKVKK